MWYATPIRMSFFSSAERSAAWKERFGPRLGGCLSIAVEILEIAIISAPIVLAIRYFVLMPFFVKGASMEPSFYNHEYLIVDEFTYHFDTPERGDIVVFRYPRDPSEYFIKRVIGLPGETVEIAEGRVILYTDEYPNGVTLSEPYLPDGTRTEGHVRTRLNLNEYFVMGDNRAASLDSRMFGPVAEPYIVGRVWFRGLPLSRITTFPSPEYRF